MHCVQRGTALFSAAHKAQPPDCASNFHVSCCDERLARRIAACQIVPVQDVYEHHDETPALQRWTSPSRSQRCSSTSTTGRRRRCWCPTSPGALVHSPVCCGPVHLMLSRAPSHGGTTVNAARIAALAHRAKLSISCENLRCAGSTLMPCACQTAAALRPSLIAFLQDNLRNCPELQDHDRQPAAGVCGVATMQSCVPWVAALQIYKGKRSCA
jgi:hypothetical protein